MVLDFPSRPYLPLVLLLLVQLAMNPNFASVADACKCRLMAAGAMAWSVLGFQSRSKLPLVLLLLVQLATTPNSASEVDASKCRLTAAGAMAWSA